MKKVTAAIIIKDGLFFIAKRRKADTLANKWEFPGGKIENGETAEECLKREIEEELRIKVRIGDFFWRKHLSVPPRGNSIISILGILGKRYYRINGT